MKEHKKQSLFGRIAGYVVLLICIGLALWLIFHRQYVIDQITVWQYHPDAAVQKLDKGAYLSKKGTFIFYASRPTVDGTQAFNQYCAKAEPQSAILGCYRDYRIYVYDVKDSRLDGIEEVTAAHEMLHAAWDRMSDKERAHLTTLLEAEYKKLNNADLNERMSYYSRAEPGERDNELHSILGTEFTGLSPELEKYYSQYFTDRDRLVALHTKYESIFDSLQKKAATLSSQLDSLSKDINSKVKAYNADVNQLNQDIAAFNQQAGANGGFSSTAEFNSQRASLMARASSLETQRAAINSEITTYQQVYKELQDTNSQSDALNRSIDSTLAPAPSV